MEQSGNVAEKTLFIKSGPTIKRVISREILYIQCEGNISRLVLLDGSELVCVRLLKHFEEDLSGAGFIRINHNMLVNLAEVTEIRYVNARKRQVVLLDDVVLDVSYRKWKSVKEALLGRK